MIGDSTNATVEGWSGSESECRKALLEVIASQPNRVAVTCFLPVQPASRAGRYRARDRPSDYGAWTKFVQLFANCQGNRLPQKLS